MKKAVLSSLFLLLIIGISSCSSKNPEDLYNEGLKNIKEQNYQTAHDLFMEIIESEPESEFAPKAYVEIANLYYSRSLRNVSQVEAYKKAAENYENVYTKYPESDLAPKSMFMKGFIESNDLNDYEKAKITLSEFVSKYPDNEMVPAAKNELETMGLTPEEILTKKEQSEK